MPSTQLVERVTIDFSSRLGKHRHWSWLADGQAIPALPEYREALCEQLSAGPLAQGIMPRLGRFYPGVLLRQSPPARVMRVTALSSTAMRLDFNAPLASRDFRQTGETLEMAVPAVGEAGHLWQWPGMEAPLQHDDTDFSLDGAMQREDEGDDAVFYGVPRLLMHIDQTCATRISSLYRELIPQAARVLDLMASCYSHLPNKLGRISGLGLNRTELSRNAQLHDFVVQDLNRDPRLPYDDASFDAAVISLSLEYLVRPQDVLHELRRVCRPGGIIIVSFSNRYFATKAIRLWTMLHPVERLGWVLAQLDTVGLKDLHSHVEVGLRRAQDDRYSGRLAAMDPLFVAWGQV